MRAPRVVLGHPGIEVVLNLVEGSVVRLAKRDAVELVENRFVKAFSDPVGLRPVHATARVVDVLDGPGELQQAHFRLDHFLVGRHVLVPLSFSGFGPQDSIGSVRLSRG